MYKILNRVKKIKHKFNIMADIIQILKMKLYFNIKL